MDFQIVKEISLFRLAHLFYRQHLCLCSQDDVRCERVFHAVILSGKAYTIRVYTDTIVSTKIF